MQMMKYNIKKGEQKEMKKVYTEKTRQEAIEAFKSGMSVLNICDLLGMSDATVYKWLGRGQAGRNSRFAVAGELRNTPPVVAQSSPVARPPEYHMPLDEFVRLLQNLATQYEKTKMELVALKKEVENWQRIAGRLNEEMKINQD
jgi:hypothetical protein